MAVVALFVFSLLLHLTRFMHDRILGRVRGACAAGSQMTRRWRKADSNRRSLPVNELVSRAGIRMRARRLGCSRKRLPCSRDHGFESAFLQRRVRCEPDFRRWKGETAGAWVVACWAPQRPLHRSSILRVWSSRLGYRIGRPRRKLGCAGVLGRPGGRSPLNCSGALGSFGR